MDGGMYWDEGVELVTGCTPCSPGCENCWHRGMVGRFGGDPDEVILRRDRIARLRTGKPRIVAIWSDLFHPGVADDFIGEAMDAAAAGPCQVLLLTKRAERMAWWFRHAGVPENVWPGVTVESQQQIGRLFMLRQIESPHLWVSVEPILGQMCFGVGISYSWLSWMVVGCETGRGARINEDTNVQIRLTLAGAASVHVPCWVKSIVGPAGRPISNVSGVPWAVRQMPAGLQVRSEPAAPGVEE